MQSSLSPSSKDYLSQQKQKHTQRDHIERTTNQGERSRGGGSGDIFQILSPATEDIHALERFEGGKEDQKSTLPPPSSSSFEIRDTQNAYGISVRGKFQSGRFYV